MKTYAAVLCALLASAVPALAHGGGGAGAAPVMTGGPRRGGFPVRSGFPVFSQPAADRTVTPDRRFKPPKRTFLPGIDYADVCYAMRVPTVYQQYQVKGGAPCSVQTQNGLLALPPPFTW